MAQLRPLPLIVSCFSKIQIGFTFLVLAHLGSPAQRAVKRVCVYGSTMQHAVLQKKFHMLYNSILPCQTATVHVKIMGDILLPYRNTGMVLISVPYANEPVDAYTT